jgi:hypothetical protein
MYVVCALAKLDKVLLFLQVVCASPNWTCLESLIIRESLGRFRCQFILANLPDANALNIYAVANFVFGNHSITVPMHAFSNAKWVRGTWFDNYDQEFLEEIDYKEDKDNQAALLAFDIANAMANRERMQALEDQMPEVIDLTMVANAPSPVQPPVNPGNPGRGMRPRRLFGDSNNNDDSDYVPEDENLEQ